MKSIRCVFGLHVNPGTSESRVTFRCGRCGKVRVRSLDELFAEVEHDFAARQDAEAFRRAER